MKKEERLEINRSHLDKGVEFIDIERAYIDKGVKIGKGSVIYPDVILEGEVEIGEDCIIGLSTRIVNSKIGNQVEIQSSHILESRVGDRTTVGPFAYLRPNSRIGQDCKIGDFVEVKNSVFGDGSKASHLTYIGDADVGEGVNLGCGVIFVNYNGSTKARTKVEDGAFIGCNSNLISPVEVKQGAYIAAGSTITQDVPEGALYIARNRGEIKEDWVRRSGILKKK